MQTVVEGREDRGPRGLRLNNEGSPVPTQTQQRSAAGRGLGWFSLGLGAAQLFAPRALCRLTGVGTSGTRTFVMRALGARELATGLALLSGRKPARWLRGRILGDALDLALLGAALTSRGADTSRVLTTGLLVAGVTALDWRASAAAGVAAVEVSHAITINRPPAEVFAFWRKLENLPVFMSHLASVKPDPNHPRRSWWTVKGPGKKTVSWDAEIVEERANELIAWRSLGDADVTTSGSVRFKEAPGGRGTEVNVDLFYQPPGGALGKLVAKAFGREPGQQIAGDLRRLKQALEIGEVVHSDASIHRGPHPARPSGDRKGVPQ